MIVKTTAARRDGQPATCAAAARAAIGRLDGAIVAVQSDWTGWRTASVCVADLEDIHWSQPPGAWRPILHAAVWCDRLQSGRIAHDCEATTAPHKLTVCVLKSHAQPAVFAELARRAGEPVLRTDAVS